MVLLTLLFTMPDLNILLANDDIDDCVFFQQALDELTIRTNLITVYDGEQLMQELESDIHPLPDILFLDLYMPRKNGFECLAEIKLNSRLKSFPVIMFSTSAQPDIVAQLYKNGALYFIRKPNEYTKLKEIIQRTITLIARGKGIQPGESDFLLTA
jgi:CheY-like chemotaxis protein